MRRSAKKCLGMHVRLLFSEVSGKHPRLLAECAAINFGRQAAGVQFVPHQLKVPRFDRHQFGPSVRVFRVLLNCCLVSSNSPCRVQTNFWATFRSRANRSRGFGTSVVIFSIADIDFLVTTAPQYMYTTLRFTINIPRYFKSQTGP